MENKVSVLKLRGNAGEQKAADFLSQNGYNILKRNWRTRQGEVDIVAWKDDVLVFAEVKTLPHGNIETIEHILGKIKQKRIVETAKCFLADNRQYNKTYIRFDVLIIDMPYFDPVYHIENAFSEFV